METIDRASWLGRIPSWITPDRLSIAHALSLPVVIYWRNAGWWIVPFYTFSVLLDVLDGALARHRLARGLMSPSLPPDRPSLATMLREGGTIDAYCDKVFFLGCLLWVVPGLFVPWLFCTTMVVEVLLAAVRYPKHLYRIPTNANPFGKIKGWVHGFAVGFAIIRHQQTAHDLMVIGLLLGLLSLAGHMRDFVQARRV